MSMPAKEFSSSTSTVYSPPLNSIRVPALRVEARSLSLLTGKFLSPRMETISFPTAPVAPTTATLYLSFFIPFPLSNGLRVLLPRAFLPKVCDEPSVFDQALHEGRDRLRQKFLPLGQVLNLAGAEIDAQPVPILDFLCGLGRF